MRWSRPEQMLVLIASAALVAGSAALLFTRRPPPTIRVFEHLPQTELVVQVDGAVLRPGLYRIPTGSRVGDALSAAGGLSPEADSSAVNQARVLRDGERVVVPARTQASVAEERRSGVKSDQRRGVGSSRVDLNRAGVSELEALPGIGPVLARRIVAHRTRHGPFHRLEDLLAVEGIGPKLLERLRGSLMIP